MSKFFKKLQKKQARAARGDSPARRWPVKGGPTTGKARALDQANHETDDDSSDDEEEPVDVYAAFLAQDWKTVLGSEVRGSDVANACMRAANRKQLARTVELLSAVTHAWRHSPTRLASLDKAWSVTFAVAVCCPDMDVALELLAAAEEGMRVFGGGKRLTNLLIARLLALSPPPPTVALTPDDLDGVVTSGPARQLVEHCQLKGYHSFALDLALCSGSFDLAFSALRNWPGDRLEVVDVAAQVTPRASAVPFVSYCLERGEVRCAISLALRLKLWGKVEEVLRRSREMSAYLSVVELASVLVPALLNDKRDLVALLLDRLPPEEVVDVIIQQSKAHRLKAVGELVIDMFLARGQLPTALSLACFLGLWVKASTIARRDFPMDRRLTARVYRTCFDKHCGPGWFSGCVETESCRELLLYVLEAPRRVPFSCNQWICIISLLENLPQCPREAKVEIVRRAVLEDSEQLCGFIGLGVDLEMLNCLLAETDPQRPLSENQLQCLALVLSNIAEDGNMGQDQGQKEDRPCQQKGSSSEDVQTLAQGTASVDRSDNEIGKLRVTAVDVSSPQKAHQGIAEDDDNTDSPSKVHAEKPARQANEEDDVVMRKSVDGFQESKAREAVRTYLHRISEDHTRESLGEELEFRRKTRTSSDLKRYSSVKLRYSYSKLPRSAVIRSSADVSELKKPAVDSLESSTERPRSWSHSANSKDKEKYQKILEEEEDYSKNNVEDRAETNFDEPPVQLNLIDQNTEKNEENSKELDFENKIKAEADLISKEVDPNFETNENYDRLDTVEVNNVKKKTYGIFDQRPENVEYKSSRTEGDDQRPARPEEDAKWSWSDCFPLLSGVSPHPWSEVMRAAQELFKTLNDDNRHILADVFRKLATRAANEGMWNCLKVITSEALRQHPMDFLMSLLHPHPERVILSYFREHEGLCLPEDREILRREKWVDFLSENEIDIFKNYLDGCLEERHRKFFLKRALAQEDWVTIRLFLQVDLPALDRRSIFMAAMEKRQWEIAMCAFDLLSLEEMGGLKDVFENAIKLSAGKVSDDLVSLMEARGLCNPYFTPQLLSVGHLRRTGRGPLALRGQTAGEGVKKAPASSSASPRLRVKFWKKRTVAAASGSTSRTPECGVILPVDLLPPNPPTTDQDYKERITSKLGKQVLAAAAKGQWTQAMNLYEGGMGPEVKRSVLQRAMEQEMWPVVIALLRRDPETPLFSAENREILTEAWTHDNWNVIEVAVETLSGEAITVFDRSDLLLRAVECRRWTLANRLLAKGVLSYENALWRALEENEWLFLIELLLLVKKEYTVDIERAIIDSMARLVKCITTPASPPTDFGMGLFLPPRLNQSGETSSDAILKDISGRLRCNNRHDVSTAVIHEAARLGLWGVCRTLSAFTSTDPLPSTPTPTDFYHLALRRSYDYVYCLLHYRPAFDFSRLDLTGLLRQLLLSPDLGVPAEAGLSMLGRLLEKGADLAVALAVRFHEEAEAAAQQQGKDLDQGGAESGVSDDTARPAAVPRPSARGDQESPEVESPEDEAGVVRHRGVDLEGSDLASSCALSAAEGNSVLPAASGNKEKHVITEPVPAFSEAAPNHTSDDVISEQVTKAPVQNETDDEIAAGDNTTVKLHKHFLDQIAQILARSNAKTFQPVVWDALILGDVINLQGEPIKVFPSKICAATCCEINAQAFDDQTGDKTVGVKASIDNRWGCLVASEPAGENQPPDLASVKEPVLLVSSQGAGDREVKSEDPASTSPHVQFATAAAVATGQAAAGDEAPKPQVGPRVRLRVQREPLPSPASVCLMPDLRAAYEARIKQQTRAGS